jgi:hypothetical protein
VLPALPPEDVPAAMLIGEPPPPMAASVPAVDGAPDEPDVRLPALFAPPPGSLASRSLLHAIAIAISAIRGAREGIVPSSIALSQLADA